MHLRKNRTRSPPPPQVRFAVLRKFMGGTSHVVLKHKLCDLAFTRTLRGAPPCAFTPRDPAEFVYWYTRAEGTPLEVNSVQEAGGACAAQGEGAGASTGVEIAPREIALARAEAARALAATGRECAMDETTLAFFFSALRQGIEQELVQLRIDGPTVKQSATDEACARQLDLLIDNHPLAGSPRHAKFRGWAFGVARGPILQGLLSLLCFDLPRARRR